MPRGDPENDLSGLRSKLSATKERIAVVRSNRERLLKEVKRFKVVTVEEARGMVKELESEARTLESEAETLLNRAAKLLERFDA